MTFFLSWHAWPRARRGGFLQLTWGAPHKKPKPLARTLMEPWWETFSKDSEVVKWQGRPPTRLTEPFFNRKGPMTSPKFFRKWPGKQSFWMSKNTGCRRLRPASGDLGPPIMPQMPPKGTVFCMVTPTKLPNIMGLKGIPLPWSPSSVRQLLLLPLVWKGGTKWWYHHKSPKDHSLSPGPDMHLMHGIFTTTIDTMKQHLHACKSMATKDKDWEWRRRIWK